MRGLAPSRDDNVLVGAGDDAAVYRLSADLALVQTVDVFTPVVDDPYLFGQVAAANSLSDVYAMGARPLLALALIGFPSATLPVSTMTAILQGGADKAREGGIEIVGGHSLDDPEPKYGLCVTGLVHPERIYRNAGARPGDLLVLTKPLGSGVLTTALKTGRLDAGHLTEAVEVMATLNRAASEAMVEIGGTACTDVTGFGLLGHLAGMLQAGEVAARVHLDAVPVMGTVRELLREGVYPGGTRRNLDFYGPQVSWTDDVDDADRLLLADAQTSGGLLIAVAASRCDVLLRALADRGVACRAVIGEIVRGSPGTVEVNRAAPQRA